MIGTCRLRSIGKLVKYLLLIYKSYNLILTENDVLLGNIWYLMTYKYVTSVQKFHILQIYNYKSYLNESNSSGQGLSPGGTDATSHCMNQSLIGWKCYH